MHKSLLNTFSLLLIQYLLYALRFAISILFLQFLVISKSLNISQNIAFNMKQNCVAGKMVENFGIHPLSHAKCKEIDVEFEVRQNDVNRNISIYAPTNPMIRKVKSIRLSIQLVWCVVFVATLHQPIYTQYL